MDAIKNGNLSTDAVHLPEGYITCGVCGAFVDAGDGEPDLGDVDVFGSFENLEVSNLWILLLHTGGVFCPLREGGPQGVRLTTHSFHPENMNG